MSGLSKKEAYLAMYSFLENDYSLSKSDDIARLLGSMSLLQDGSTADPACWEDWEDSIKKVKSGKVNAELILTK